MSDNIAIHLGRVDPIFNLETPLLFAHRGGAAEVPESTEEAFRHAALKVGVDVLEIDIQVTQDNELVVWHGPKLDIVHDGKRFLKGRDIRDENFQDSLKCSAWVIHPDKPDEMIESNERRLLTLENFLNLVNQIENDLRGDGLAKTFHLNIELKSGYKNNNCWIQNWDKLFGLLNLEIDKRKIILASAKQDLLTSLRKEISSRASKRYITNLSINEQLSFRDLMPNGITSQLFKRLVPLSYKAKFPSTSPYAFETYYKLGSKKLIQKVKDDESVFYVFLTGIFIFPAVDNKSEKKLKKTLIHLLEIGVDGIMTDYPEKITKILRELKVRH